MKYDLWWQFTVRAVEMRHRGSYLGVLWTVLNPLLNLGMYVIIFGYIGKGHFNAFPHESTLDYSLAVFLGLIIFQITAETIAVSPTYIITNPNLVKKVVFPLRILPLANISALWFHFTVSFCLLLIACLATSRPPSLTGLLWMPVLLTPHVMATVGLSWFLAAFGVFFRDISQIVNFLTQVVLYASSVFFPVSLLKKSPALWAVLKWNPMLHTVDLSRRALLWDQPIDLKGVLYTWLAGFAILWAGSLFFKKWQPAFADVL
jgi:lipopolysaccharide transport system permease protein